MAHYSGTLEPMCTSITTVRQPTTADQEKDMKQQSFTWRKLSLAVMAFTLALPAMAQVCDPDRCIDQIGHLYVSDKPMNGFPNKALVFVNVAHPNDMHNLNCTLQSDSYMTLQPDHPGCDQIFSVLQAYAF